MVRQDLVGFCFCIFPHQPVDSWLDYFVHWDRLVSYCWMNLYAFGLLNLLLFTVYAPIFDPHTTTPPPHTVRLLGMQQLALRPQTVLPPPPPPYLADNVLFRFCCAPATLRNDATVLSALNARDAHYYRYCLAVAWFCARHLFVRSAGAARRRTGPTLQAPFCSCVYAQRDCWL